MKSKDFQRNQLLGSAGQSDPVGRVVTVNLISGGIRFDSIDTGTKANQKNQRNSIDLNPLVAQLGSIGRKSRHQ